MLLQVAYKEKEVPVLTIEDALKREGRVSKLGWEEVKKSSPSFTWCDPRWLRGRRSVRMRTAPQCRESLPLGASFTSTWKPIPRSAGAVASL